jgi:hypothetical protein
LSGLPCKIGASAFSAPQVKQSGERLIYGNHDYLPTRRHCPDSEVRK